MVKDRGNFLGSFDLGFKISGPRRLSLCTFVTSSDKYSSFFSPSLISFVCAANYIFSSLPFVLARCFALWRKLYRLYPARLAFNSSRCLLQRLLRAASFYDNGIDKTSEPGAHVNADVCCAVLQDAVTTEPDRQRLPQGSDRHDQRHCRHSPHSLRPRPTDCPSRVQYSTKYLPIHAARLSQGHVPCYAAESIRSRCASERHQAFRFQSIQHLVPICR